MSQAMLQVKTASKHFLGLKAVDEVSLTVRPGEIVSIIGPNGAGKTTFFNLLTGQLAPTSGEVLFEGRPINHLPPHARARLGMGRTFQISKPLIALTALENVMIGAFLRDAPLSVARDKAMVVLEKVGLARLAMRRAGDLTLSERRRLEVARALALRTGEPVIEVRRTLAFGGVPTILEELWLPGDRFKGLSAERLAASQGPMYAMFEAEFGISMVRADERLRAVLPDEQQAQWLQVNTNTPLLSVERVAFTYNDLPMELRRGLYRTDMHHYRNQLF
jgi:predicted ABC-type transport system involved in lysophospholipase L1 biosynthesis ATPase subunit